MFKGCSRMGSKMAQQVKAFAAKLHDLSSPIHDR